MKLLLEIPDGTIQRLRRGNFSRDMSRSTEKGGYLKWEYDSSDIYRAKPSWY